MPPLRHFFRIRPSFSHGVTIDGLTAWRTFHSLRKLGLMSRATHQIDVGGIPHVLTARPNGIRIIGRHIVHAAGLKPSALRVFLRHTTMLPSCAESLAFLIHFEISRPYGGFMNTTWLLQSCFNPSSSAVKCCMHFALSCVEQGSNVNPNSLSNASNSHWGVPHYGVADENNDFCTISFLLPMRRSISHELRLCAHGSMAGSGKNGREMVA